MECIFEHLLPLAITRVLDVLTEIGNCVQKNGESVDHYASQMENLFLQVEKLGYKSVESLKLAYCQRGILQGAYHKHQSLSHFTEKLQNDEFNLKSFANPHDFFKNMSRIFTNKKVYKEGKMTPLSAHQVGEARAASGVYGGNFDKVSVCTTQEEANAVMKTNNCPLCRLPKGHAKSYHISQCPWIKSMGLKVNYTKDTDQ